MIFFMNSKTFFKHFLEREDDTTILNSNYIIASKRIRKHSDIPNVATVHNLLYPNYLVFSEEKENKMIEKYFDQLEYSEARGFFSLIIKASIKDDADFIFLTTKKEDRFPYLKWIQEYIMYVFQYPVYDYKAYINGCEIVDYDEDFVLKKCKKVGKEVKEKQERMRAQSEEGRVSLIKSLKKKKKKEVIKTMKNFNLEYKGLTKEEMLDLLKVSL